MQRPVLELIVPETARSSGDVDPWVRTIPGRVTADAEASIASAGGATPRRWRGRRGWCRQDAQTITRQLEEAIKKLPEIVSCHYISGTGTFELQVVAQDLEAFSKFALQNLINLPNVKDLHTSFSLGEVKASSALPLGHLTRTAA